MVDRSLEDLAVVGFAQEERAEQRDCRIAVLQEVVVETGQRECAAELFLVVRAQLEDLELA
jgi:hypothetical protein